MYFCISVKTKLNHIVEINKVGELIVSEDSKTNIHMFNDSIL